MCRRLRQNSGKSAEGELISLKTFGKSIVLFLVFLLGTASLVHVDRQCAQIDASHVPVIERLENFIDK